MPFERDAHFAEHYPLAFIAQFLCKCVDRAVQRELTRGQTQENRGCELWEILSLFTICDIKMRGFAHNAAEENILQYSF
jgi:hypothetical protein